MAALTGLTRESEQLPTTGGKAPSILDSMERIETVQLFDGDIPSEMLGHTFTQLPTMEIGRCILVCTTWYRLIVKVPIPEVHIKRQRFVRMLEALRREVERIPTFKWARCHIQSSVKELQKFAVAPLRREIEELLGRWIENRSTIVEANMKWKERNRIEVGTLEEALEQDNTLRGLRRLKAAFAQPPDPSNPDGQFPGDVDTILASAIESQLSTSSVQSNERSELVLKAITLALCLKPPPGKLLGLRRCALEKIPNVGERARALARIGRVQSALDREETLTTLFLLQANANNQNGVVKEREQVKYFKLLSRVDSNKFLAEWSKFKGFTDPLCSAKMREFFLPGEIIRNLEGLKEAALQSTTPNDQDVVTLLACAKREQELGLPEAKITLAWVKGIIDAFPENLRDPLFLKVVKVEAFINLDAAFVTASTLIDQSMRMDALLTIAEALAYDL